MRFRKKPVVIDAIRFSGTNHDKIQKFMGLGGFVMKSAFVEFVFIDTYEGQMRASPGDWIIRGVKGEYYPCKPDIFKETYERVK